MVEPIVNPVANAFKYAEPVITKIDISVSEFLQSGAEKLENAELSYKEQKKIFKAAIKA